MSGLNCHLAGPHGKALTGGPGHVRSAQAEVNRTRRRAIPSRTRPLRAGGGDPAGSNTDVIPLVSAPRRRR
ncbi:hypothetical protein GCM10010294_07300 [Streptomyces griseoloalbus]|nr:hypothetical protein GCM10010294_07300 [Streptomyces griseoloalbus]